MDAGNAQPTNKQSAFFGGTHYRGSVLAAEGGGNAGQRQDLRHEGGGNTRQSQWRKRSMGEALNQKDGMQVDWTGGCIIISSVHGNDGPHRVIVGVARKT